MPFEDRYDAQVAQQMLDLGNKMPGLPHDLGVRLERFEAGRLWARADFADQVPTPSGNVHGGALAAVMDHVTGAVIYPLIPFGFWGATTELKINYIAPASTGILEVEATVLAITNRSAVVRADASMAGRLVCAAQGTITIVAPRAETAP